MNMFYIHLLLLTNLCQFNHEHINNDTKPTLSMTCSVKIMILQCPVRPNGNTMENPYPYEVAQCEARDHFFWGCVLMKQ